MVDNVLLKYWHYTNKIVYLLWNGFDADASIIIIIINKYNMNLFVNIIKIIFYL